jgi:hypothetical protein
VSCGQLGLADIAGGAVRVLAPRVYAADLADDGSALAKVVSDVGQQRLEYPEGSVVFETAGWISRVRISPDGERVAFLDHPI